MSSMTEKDDELRRRAWTEHVAHLIADGDPLIAELEDLGVDIPQLRLAFERFADYPDVVEWPTDEIALPDPAPIAAAIENYAARMEALAPALPADAGNDKLIPQYRRFPRLVRHANLSLAGRSVFATRAICSVDAQRRPEELARRQGPGPGRKGSLGAIRSRACRSLRRSDPGGPLSHDPESPSARALSFTIASVTTPAGSIFRTCY